MCAVSALMLQKYYSSHPIEQNDGGFTTVMLILKRVMLSFRQTGMTTLPTPTSTPYQAKRETPHLLNAKSASSHIAKIIVFA